MVVKWQATTVRRAGSPIPAAAATADGTQDLSQPTPPDSEGKTDAITPRIPITDEQTTVVHGSASAAAAAPRSLSSNCRRKDAASKTPASSSSHSPTSTR